MAQIFAEASFVLKISIKCQACRLRTVDILHSIVGEYNIEINTDEESVRVYAMVDPNRLLKELARSGIHAELKSASIRHPRLNRNFIDNECDSYSYRHGNGYGHNMRNVPPYGYMRGLPGPFSYAPHYNPVESNFYPGWPNACVRPRPFGY